MTDLDAKLAVMDQLIRKCADKFVAMFPRDLQPLVVQGLGDMRASLNQLAWEVVRAEAEQIPFTKAVQRESYPTMAKVHHGLLDLLQLEIPAADRAALRAFMRKARRGDAEPFVRHLQIAAKGSGGPGPALARFIYYEALRLTVWYSVWDDPGSLELSGAAELLDHRAEGLLREELRSVHVVPGGTSLTILVLQSLSELDRHICRIHRALKRSGGEFVRRWNQGASLYGVARELTAPDAVVVRTALDDVFLDRPPPGDHRLVDLHPLAFASVEAAQKRRSRLRHGRTLRPGATAKKTRIVDLLQEQLEEMQQ